MTTQNNNDPFLPFPDVFDAPNFFMEEPEFGLLGALGQQNLPRNMDQFFRSRVGDLLQQYNQALSGQILGGQLPTLNPFDFFSGQTPGFGGFREEYGKFSPTQRGFQSGQFAPMTRFIFK